MNRPDFIPAGQEGQYGIGKAGRHQDYIPGPALTEEDLEREALEREGPAPSPHRAEILAVPDPGAPPSPIMSPGPAADRLVEEGLTPRAAVAKDAAQPVSLPVEEAPKPPRMTKAQREAAAKEAVEAARRAQEEADRLAKLAAAQEEEEAAAEETPESGAKGGAASSTKHEARSAEPGKDEPPTSQPSSVRPPDKSKR